MDSFDFAQYLQPLRKWWWLVLGSLLLAAISSFLYARSVPIFYRSHATAMVGGGTIENPNPQGNEFYMAQTLAGIYADLGKRANVSAAVMNALGLDALPDYSISVVPGTQLIEVAVIDTDPARAQVVAEELINQIIRLGPAGQEEEQQQVFIEQQLQLLQQSILDAQKEIVLKGDALAAALSAREIVQIRSDTAALEVKISTLQANYAALLSRTVNGAANRVSVIEPASLPTTPEPSTALLNLLLAAAIGGILGAGTAYLLEFLDDSVATVTGVEQLGLTTLSAVPVVTEAEGNPGELVMVNDPHSSAAEAYRVLRTNLQFACVDQPRTLIQVTSPVSGEGKSWVSANLALALAQLDVQVILVDADLHLPTQHRLFQKINNIGLTSALLGDPDLVETFLRPTMVPNLRLLTSGPLPPNPAELLGSKRMKAILGNLKSIADLVIVDGPPVTAISDTVTLAKATDGVLLVFRAGMTRNHSAKRAIAALRQVQIHCLGAVLNAVPERTPGYYYRYDRAYVQPYYRRHLDAVVSAPKRLFAFSKRLNSRESP